MLGGGLLRSPLSDEGLCASPKILRASAEGVGDNRREDLLHETPYGIAKRFKYVADVIRREVPKRVLDVGCGTGLLLTMPLARRFPETVFIGVDIHVPTIEFARTKFRLPNLRFMLVEELDAGLFDLIIASEVLEHVTDPEAFAAWVRSRLASDGKVFLTIPNGYGPFEMMSLIEDVLFLSGLYGLVQRIMHRTKSCIDLEPGQIFRDSLALQPHINFFSFGALLRFLRSAGFRLVDYRARTLFCGFVLDHLVSRLRLEYWNARVADSLPPFAVSDWMVLLEPGPKEEGFEFRRGPYARLHGYLNRLRWRCPP